MTKIVVGIVLLVMLVGCAAFEEIDRGMAAMVGQHETELIEVLGWPDSQVEIGEEKIYAYRRSESGSTSYTTYDWSPTYDSMGAPTGYTNTESTNTISYQSECVLKFKVVDEVIVDYQYAGDWESCYYYADKLREVPAKYGTNGKGA